MIFSREKASGDVQDYDFNYTFWLASLQDTGSSSTVTVSPGITLVSSNLANGVVKVWLSGGTDGQTYVITSTLTTSGGRRKNDILMLTIAN